MIAIFRSETGRAIAQNVSCIFALIIINYVTFHGHYRGLRIFPWDFIGGYHFQSYGWWHSVTGTFFGPSPWFPWGGMGFPSALALQSGGWYLPAGLPALFDSPYTLSAAAIIQCAHVLTGAIGCYFLLRRFNIGALLALVGAIGFHFGTAFYSNQQHVDIIRAYALFPWLLWCLHPATLRHFFWGPALGALVLFQFLVGAYPGNIVAAVYACAILFLIMYRVQESTQERRAYLLATAVTVTAGATLSALKWLPFFATPELQETGVIHPAGPSGPIHFFTLILPYARDLYQTDLTMRGVYLPLTAWIGVIFIRRFDLLAKVGVWFFITAIFCGTVLPTLSPYDRFLPGLNLSRFPLSDWRMVWHIGLLMLGCSGWAGLSRGELSIAQTLSRLIIATAAGLIGAAYALRFGYPVADLKLVLPYVLTVFGLTLFLAKPRFRQEPTIKAVALAMLVLIPAVAIEGFSYHRSQRAPWVLDWGDAAETEFFGAPIKTLHEIHHVPNEKQTLEKGRPERYVIGNDFIEVMRQQNDIRYNRCWYAHTYCLLGYNNLRASLPHNTIAKVLADPETGPALLAYMRKASHLLISTDVQKGADIKTVSLRDDSWSGDTIGSEVQPLQFSPNLIQYRISAPTAVRITENEMWWKGWTYQACSSDGQGCQPILPTEHTEHYLRTWTLPPGDWIVTLIFTQPGATAAKLLALCGVLLLLFYTMAKWFCSRKERV